MADHSDTISVRINEKEAKIRYARVSAIPYNMAWPGHQRPLEDTEIAPFVSFTGDGTARISVRSGRIRPESDLTVRPLSRRVEVIRSGEEAVFELKEHGGYTFEIDGFREALHIFYDPVRDFLSEEASSGRNVIHYTRGEYHTGNTEVPPHTSVVIDEGAVIYGSFTAIGADDIRICGYGIIDGSSEERTDDTGVLPYSYYDRPHRCDLTKEENLKSVLSSDRMLNGCLRFYNCRDFSVEGVILRDSAAFTVIPANCDGFVIDNVKTIGMWRFNSDGIDLFNSRNAVIRNCFLRNFDDCIVIKGVRGWDTANNENILVENCVIWCDWGSALEIGAETNADLYRNIVFRNCDVIHGASVMMRIQNSNRADIRNVRFENIRTEFSRYCLPRKMMEEGVPYEGKPNTRQPRLFHLMIRQDTPYSDIPLSGTVEDVTISGLQVYLDGEVSMPKSDIEGKDEDHEIRNVRIGLVMVNSEPVRGFSRYVNVNPFTENITFMDQTAESGK